MTEPWRHKAACKNKPSEWWFPDDGSRTHTTLKPENHHAIQICKTCPVQQQCATWAITKPEHHGIWGALTAEQRRGIRRQQRDTIPCGTKSGYEKHLRWGQPACGACKRAHADYTNARRRIRERARTRHHLDDDGDTA